MSGDKIFHIQKWLTKLHATNYLVTQCVQKSLQYFQGLSFHNKYISLQKMKRRKSQCLLAYLHVHSFHGMTTRQRIILGDTCLGIPQVTVSTANFIRRPPTPYILA